MAVVFIHPNGNVHYRHHAEEEKQHPVPTGAINIIRFDEATNPVAVRALNTDYNSHSLAGGMLRRNGVPVGINPPGPAYQDRELLVALLSKLTGPLPLTPDEVKVVLRVLLREAKLL